MAVPLAQQQRTVQVTREDADRFCEFLYRRTGMLFTEAKRYYIDRRLAERIAATGSTSFQSYFAILRSDTHDEIEHLVNAFTVNETYFYREDHQFRCMTFEPPRRGHSAKIDRGADPHLVYPMLDRRRALFNCHMADGKLEASRSIQYRNRRIGH